MSNNTKECEKAYVDNAGLRADIALAFDEPMALCPIEEWDVSLVSDFSNVFRHVNITSQNLGQWDVSNAVTFAGMFSFAKNFVGNGLENWNGKTRGVISMSNMFNNAGSFDGNISGWEVGSVTDFSNMFAGAASFSPLKNESTSLELWDVSKGTNFEGMFKGAEMFNDGGVDGWNLANAVRSRTICVLVSIHCLKVA